MEYKKRTHCAICENTNINTIVYLGDVPLAGNFPLDTELENIKKYELSLEFCDNCKLVQTDSIIDSDTLFKDYRYMSSIGLTNHFTMVADMYKKRFNLNKSHKILEIGCNDGVLLKPLMELGLNPIGIEPATNIAKFATNNGCNVINDYFNEDTAEKYFCEKFDLIISNNCFAHIDNIKSIVKGIKKILKKEAHFVIEVHYLKNLVDELQFDFIYHEHLYYYSLNSLKNLFNQFDMTIVDYEEFSIHSGSIRVYVKNSKEPLNKKIIDKINFENKSGLTNISYFTNFGLKIKNHIGLITEKVKTIKNNGFKIAGYGASGRGNMLINLCGFNNNDIDYIVDESPERVNRFIPISNIPIVSKEILLLNKPDYIFIFAWNYFDSIKAKIDDMKLDVKYILPF
jgi:SAM-dependent methyltransferase